MGTEDLTAIAAVTLFSAIILVLALLYMGHGF